MTLNEQLIQSVKNKDLQSVKKAIMDGADVGYNGCYAFRLSCHEGNLDIAKYLVKNGADINAYDGDALTWATQRGHLDVVKYLVDIGVNVTYDILELAINNGNVDVASYLIDIKPDVNHIDKHCLIQCSSKGYLSLIKRLICKGVDINKDYSEMLRCAKENNHLEVVRYLTLINKMQAVKL